MFLALLAGPLGCATAEHADAVGVPETSPADAAHAAEPPSVPTPDAAALGDVEPVTDPSDEGDGAGDPAEEPLPWVDYQELSACPPDVPPENLVCYTLGASEEGMSLDRLEPGAGLEARVLAIEGDSCYDDGITLVLDQGYAYTCASGRLIRWDLATGERERFSTNCSALAPHELGVALDVDDGGPDQLHVYSDLAAAERETGMRRVLLDGNAGQFLAFDATDTQAVGTWHAGDSFVRFDPADGAYLGETFLEGVASEWLEGVNLVGDEVVVLVGSGPEVLSGFDAATGAHRWSMALQEAHKALRCGCVLPG